MKPRNERVRTNVKGWMQDPNNVSYNEKIELTRQLRDKDISIGNVILDLAEKKVVRNRFRPEGNFDDIFEYYYKNYTKYIDPVIKQMGYEMVDVKNESIVSETVQTQETASSGSERTSSTQFV